ncbi:glycosyltransferase [Gordonia phage Yvonnetastic]|uniref:Glycosyltransferase n=1 Tax=Gordonia phage Yvonnetastic TaxID=1821566 RepID=A0A142K8Y6_9CAUD|nr:glycosyltransferase [Gordonia phage Yvonnetastic]AMS02569.1 glycosyltransferase [Gordonia phage Yvonnetastic]
MIELSILVCSTHTRYNTFAPKIQEQLYGQLNESNQDRVEILMLTDNKQIMLGEKRNMMVEMAQGEWVVFVDDDDRVAPDYIDQLLAGITEARKADVLVNVITFNASVSINGKPPKLCRYSHLYTEDHDTADEYHRLPNHICCVRRDTALRVPFPSIPYGEDSGYSKQLIELLIHGLHIDKVLYYYDYNSSTSETQQQKPASQRKKPKVREQPIVDVVFLSNAKSESMYQMTKAAIQTCRDGARGHRVNVIVLEQSSRYCTYLQADRVVRMPKEFHYNKFANKGAQLGTAPWLIIANNDLVFSSGWLEALLDATANGHTIVSPRCPVRHPVNSLVVDPGWVNGVHFAGWCFMMSRRVYELIGGFDECVSFWCSDDVVLEQLKEAAQGPPALVGNSIVTHLGSETLKSADNYDDMTWAQVHAFNEHHGQNKFSDHPKYTRWKARNGIRT